MSQPDDLLQVLLEMLDSIALQPVNILESELQILKWSTSNEANKLWNIEFNMDIFFQQSGMKADSLHIQKNILTTWLHRNMYCDIC